MSSKLISNREQCSDNLSHRRKNDLIRVIVSKNDTCCLFTSSASFVMKTNVQATRGNQSHYSVLTARHIRLPNRYFFICEITLTTFGSKILPITQS